jgi:hypothetical protein
MAKETRGVPGSLVRALPLGMAFAALSCGSLGGSTGVEPTEEEPAVSYEMAGSEFLPSSNLPPNILVVMSVQNDGAVPVDKQYPAGCPVRLRVYRNLDDQLLYDETRLPCTVEGSATFRILPGETRSIGSGFRSMTQIMGDSIPCGRYRLVGIPQMEGGTIIEIDAGEAYLRAYPSWPMPNPDAVHQC